MERQTSVKTKLLPYLLAVVGLFWMTNPSHSTPQPSLDTERPRPLVGGSVMPVVWNGDLRDLVQVRSEASTLLQIPLRSIPGKSWPEAPANWVDPVKQVWAGISRMPLPLMSFSGLSRADAGGYMPPDTNGDVGPEVYIQTVNVGIGFYRKATGEELVNVRFDDLFGGTDTPCDYSNRGDVIALYDPLADRWLVTDFAWAGSTGPYYQCIALSQTGDPVSGGWYLYAMYIDLDSLHDYPKFGVWPDGYYMSANMFGPHGWEGAKIWALDRVSLLGGGPLNSVSFDLGPSYGSLLPANLRGAAPPTGSPAYFASIDYPNQLQIWEFHVDWATPSNSTLNGPTELTVADFGYVIGIPQQPPGELVDSVADRLMMQLQYRNLGSLESLWVNHTVDSNGVAGIRWYEVRDPGGRPAVYQAGTYQPDENYRWMGSLAVDQDGNMAVGYSVSSESMKPAIRYAGRLAGEIPGALLQGEESLIEGTGVQVGGGGRWGDYSAMSVDPTDDCTFWYTQEYYETTGSQWQTRIGSFRFPSCGQPKGWLAGTVYNATTLSAIPGVTIVAEGVTTTLTVETDASGDYSMTLPANTYTVTAGPLLPGYPEPSVLLGASVTAGVSTERDLLLVPRPFLDDKAVTVDDDVTGGNGNGHPEPGETDLLLWVSIANTGATTATHATSHLEAQAPGVTLTVAEADYPDIAAGESVTNPTPLGFSIAPTVTCGARLDLLQILTTDQGVYSTTFWLRAMVPFPAVTLFEDDMESGSGGWSSGGTNDQWAITEEGAHSPSHAWSDSPGGDYLNDTNGWLRLPNFDLSAKTGLTLDFWHHYDLETGWDFALVEYSLDGGANWQTLRAFTGAQDSWKPETLDLSFLDGQPQAAFRFRLETDSFVTEDGWYIDDVCVWHQPFACFYRRYRVHLPIILRRP